MRTALFLLLTTIAAIAQPTQQIASIGDLQLVNGKTIPDCKVGYRTYGTLNVQQSNAVLFPTWFSGRAEDLDSLIGPGKLADSSKLYIIAVDALGDGISSSPSTSTDPAAFPDITIRDMVNSQHALLTKVLKIDHLRAVMGISMGGMQTFQWLTAYPKFLDLAIPIVGSPKLTSIDLLLWQAELSAIEAAGEKAMEAVNAMHQFALYTPGYRVEKTDYAAIKPTLAEHRMAAVDWAAQLRAMMAQDVGPATGVKARVLVIVATQDHMVNPTPALKLAAALKAQTLVLSGNCGHMATSCESDKIVPAVHRFFAAAR